MLRTNSELVGELDSKKRAREHRRGADSAQEAGATRERANGYCKILWQPRVLAWDWTGLNGLVADSGDGVWGAGIRGQGRGFLVRSRNKDSEPIRASVKRPSDHDAQGDEGEKGNEARKEDDESGGHLK